MFFLFYSGNPEAQSSSVPRVVEQIISRGGSWVKSLQTFRRVFQALNHSSCRKSRKVWSFHLVLSVYSPWPLYTCTAFLEHTCSIHTPPYPCCFYPLCTSRVDCGLALCSTQLPLLLSTHSGVRWCCSYALPFFESLHRLSFPPWCLPLFIILSLYLLSDASLIWGLLRFSHICCLIFYICML